MSAILPPVPFTHLEFYRNIQTFLDDCGILPPESVHFGHWGRYRQNQLPFVSVEPVTGGAFGVPGAVNVSAVGAFDHFYQVDDSLFTGTSALSLSGVSPNDRLIVVEFTTDGTVGITGAEYRVSTNSGQTFGAITPLGTASSISVAGMTISFGAGTVDGKILLPVFETEQLWTVQAPIMVCVFAQDDNAENSLSESSYVEHLAAAWKLAFYVLAALPYCAGNHNGITPGRLDPMPLNTEEGHTLEGAGVQITFNVGVAVHDVRPDQKIKGDDTIVSGTFSLPGT
jgi:hypothetical protein